jgi:hypothetical protein
MKRLALTLFVCLAVPAFAEPAAWVTAFTGGSRPAGVAALRDGSSVVAYTASPCSLSGHDKGPDFRNRMAVARVDSTGRIVYDVEIPRPKEVLARLRGASVGVIDGIAALPDGDLLLVAEFIEGQPWLVRIDGDSGGVRFSKFIGDEKGHTVISSVAAAGDDVVIGGGLETDLYLARYSGNGQKRWEKVVNAGGIEAVYDLAVMSDGSAVATAMLQPAPEATAPQAMIIRLDKEGRELAQRRFEGETPVVAVTRDTIGIAYEVLPPNKQALRFRVFDAALAELAEVPFDNVTTGKRLVAFNDTFQLLYAGKETIRMTSLTSRGKPQGDREAVTAKLALEMRVAAGADSVYLAFIAAFDTEAGRICTKARLARIPITTTTSNRKAAK